MSNLLDLADARTAVGRFVEAGTCSNSVIDPKVSEACRRLMVKADWPFTLQACRIRVSHQSFPLPRECVAIRWANIENEAIHVWNQAYEFMAVGPGEIKHRITSTGRKDLVDMGMWPVMFDIPPIEDFATDAVNACDRTLEEGWKLVAFSTEVEDIREELKIYGTNKLHNEQGSGGPGFLPGITLGINRWQDGEEGVIAGAWSDMAVTTARFRQIFNWKKPLTKGYISLYAVDTETNYMYFIAKAHPDDTKPLWRRFKISGMALTGGCSNILALLKMKALMLTRADDILPIQNLDAIKSMVIAIREENNGNLDNALKYETNATRILNEQLQDHETSGGTPVIIDFDMELTAQPFSDMII